MNQPHVIRRMTHFLVKDMKMLIVMGKRKIHHAKQQMQESWSKCGSELKQIRGYFEKTERVDAPKHTAIQIYWMHQSLLAYS